MVRLYQIIIMKILVRLVEMYNERDLKNPACVVDANHSNSNKQYMEQIRIVKEVLHSRSHSKDVADLVKGVMIKSYIEGGCQKIGAASCIWKIHYGSVFGLEVIGTAYL